MIEPGRARRLGPGPGVFRQDYQRLCAVRRQPGRLSPAPGNLEAEHVAIKAQRTIQIGHCQVDRTDCRIRMDYESIAHFLLTLSLLIPNARVLC
jgi:hypothetical protein